MAVAVQEVVAALDDLSDEELKAVAEAAMKQFARRMYACRKEAIMTRRDIERLQEETKPDREVEGCDEEPPRAVRQRSPISATEAVRMVLRDRPNNGLNKRKLGRAVLNETTFVTEIRDFANFLRSLYQGALRPMIMSGELKRRQKNYVLNPDWDGERV